MKTLEDVLREVGSTAEFLFTTITDVNQKSPWGDSPLHMACRWGELDAVATLISAGADVNAIGEAKMTPLCSSAMVGKSSGIVQLLLESGADPMIQNEDGSVALDCARMALILASRDTDINVEETKKIISLLEAAAVYS